MENSSLLYNLVIYSLAAILMALFVLIEIRYKFNPAVTGLIFFIAVTLLLSLVDSALRKRSRSEALKSFKDFTFSYFEFYLIFIFAAVSSYLPHNFFTDLSAMFVLLFVIVNLFPLMLDASSGGKDPPQYLRRIFEDMKAKMDIKGNVRLRIFESSLMKTALLGGLIRPTVFINEDLLSMLSEDELRSVIAHELAHYKGGDLIRYMGYTLLIYAVLTPLFKFIVSSAGLSPQSGSVTVLLLFIILFLGTLSAFLILIRRREIRADLIAATYTNPEDLINALIKLYKASEGAPSFLPTHPSLEKRIEFIKRANRDVGG